MYNYNTNEGGTGAFIRDLAIKLIFVVILILLILWLYPKPDMKPYYDRFFTENITLMKDTAKAYYTDERLPKEVDDKVTMTLEEMVNKHLILNLTDKKGNFCDTKKSYVEVTKLKTEYAMKVYLSCGSEYDYIIEYIGCTTVCENCGTTPLVAPPVKTVTKPTTVVKPVPTTPTTPVTPKPTTRTVNVYSKAPEIIDSNWMAVDNAPTTSTINGITTTTNKLDTRSVAGSVYYTRKTATVYSAGWISDSTKTGATYDYKGVRILNLTNLGMSYTAQKLDLNSLNFTVDNWSKLTTLSDFQTYLDNKGRTFHTSEYSAWNSDVHTNQGPTAQQLQESTITQFKIIDLNATTQNSEGKPVAIWNDQYKTFQIYTRAWIFNKAYIKPYFDQKLGMNIYFLMHKFNVSWNEPSTSSTYEYRYRTTITYEDRTVTPGSVEEATLKANGYVFKEAKVISL